MDNENLNYSLKSLIKSINLFEQLVDGGEMSIAELSSVSGLGKSNVHRILGTFKSLGYVGQNVETGKYYATLKIYGMGNRVSKRIPLRRVAKPYLYELFEKCHETVNLAVYDDGEVIFLDKIITKEPLRIELDIGKSVPPYCSALGKTFMAYSKDIVLEDIDFKKHTDTTITSWQELNKELEIIRQNDYAIDNEEYIKGLKCIAVPIFDKNRHAVAAISIATPTLRLDSDKEIAFIEYLKEAVQKISNEMGY